MSIGERFTRGFAAPEARARVVAAVRLVEAASAAEVVVTVRPSSDAYRETAHLAAAIASFGAILLFLFHPLEIETLVFPPVVVALYAFVAWTSGRAPLVARWLAGEKRRDAAVAREAKIAFVDLGVSRTRARTGVLVLVSVLERRARLVADVTAATALDDEAGRAAVATLEGSIEHGDVETFSRALEALGPLLARTLPRGDDDVNELADEVRLGGEAT